MPEALPIACSLSAAQLSVRLVEIAALGRDALVDARVAGTHAELRFTADPRIRTRVERFAEAERRCCAFLSLHVGESPDAVVLTVDAPPDAAGVVAELVAALGEGSAPTPRPASRRTPTRTRPRSSRSPT